MKNFIKWIPAILLLSLFSCSKVENEVDFAPEFTEPGVYGYLTPIEFDYTLDTKGTADPNTLEYVWEIGDRINIWSSSGTLLIYAVESIKDNGRAEFSGGGFTLTDGETYYSSHPLILSVKDDYKTLTTSYVGETQVADNDADHIADYTYTYSSAKCTNGNTSFQYHHLSAFIKFTVTLPEALTLKELTLTADSDVFALNGEADVTTGTFTPGEMSNTMTLKLDDIQVTDGVLNASLAVAPFSAGTFVVRVKGVKDGVEKVYTSPEISKGALAAGKGTLFAVEVFEGENPPVAKIGDVYYDSLVDAVADVPTDGTETTITMIGDESIAIVGENYGVTIPNNKKVIIDLNGRTVTGACSTGATSALILNKGTLTICDSGSGGKLIGGADPTWTWDGSDDYTGSYASNVVRNEGTITVNGGTLYNASSGSAAYAIDNYGSGKVTINGGTLDAKKASAIRMFYNNGGEVNVNGGSIGHYNSDSDCSYMGVQAQNGTGAVINISGGFIAGSYAVYSNGTGDSAVHISGGSFDGYVGLAAAGPAIVSISGGMFNAWVGTWNTTLPGFITGGFFAVDPSDYVADGYIAVANTDAETMEDYPFVVIADTNEYAAKIGETKYLTLAAAIAAVPTDGTATTITLLVDLTENLVLGDGKSVVLDLGGKTLTGSVDQYDSDLNVTNGTIAGTVYVNGGTSGTDYNSFTLAADATISNSFGIILYQSDNNTAYGSTIDIYGTVNGVVWVMGNIVEGDSVINVNSGAKVSGDLGFALNGVATLNVYDGATVEGSESGIEVRAGTLNVSGGTISSTATEYTVSSNGSGTTTVGAAIAVAQHTTKLATNVTISNATLTGVKTISVADPEGNGLEDVTVTVADVLLGDAVVIPDFCEWKSNGDNTSTLKMVEYVAQIGDVKYKTLAEAIAAVPTDGPQTTITMIGDEDIVGNAGVTIAAGKSVVLDLNGKTITQTGPMSGTSYLIKNQGTLNIKDSSDTDHNGSGDGKMICNAADPDTGDIPSYANNLISNYSVLSIESGFFQQLTNAGYASFVVDNYNGGTASISGGKLGNVANQAYVVRMFLNSTSVDNVLNISGTAIIEGSYAVWMQYANSNANKGTLNISGGTLNASGGRALYGGAAGGNTRNASNVNVSISGGTINGTGAWIGADSPFHSISVTGGHFADFGISDIGGSKFVTGGVYESISLFYADSRELENTIVADGYKVVLDNGLYYVVGNSDPREAVEIPFNNVYYYWPNGSGYKGEYCDFAEPFVEDWLFDGEFIRLRANVNLNANIACQMTSGSFTLIQGAYSVTKGNYSVTLKPGVSVKTDKQTDIFSAAEVGYTVVETAISDGDYHYLYTVTKSVAQVGSASYATLVEAAAAAAAASPATIKLVDDVELSASVVFSGNVTLDLNGKTISVDANTCDPIIVNDAGATLRIIGAAGSTIDASGYSGDDGTAVWAKAGTVIIESGTIINKSTKEATLYVSGANANIQVSGGTFKNIAEGNYQYAAIPPIVLNVKNDLSVNQIQVSGGSFYCQNPADGDDNLGGTFLVDGKTATAIMDGSAVIGYQVQ